MNTCLRVVSLWLSLWTLIAEQQQVESFSAAKTRSSKRSSSTTTTSRARPLTNQDDVIINRQKALKYIVSPIIWAQASQIAQAKISIKPDAAFQSLIAARQELNTVSTQYLSKQDYEGMKDYLSDPSLNINNYEENAGVLLASKQLDAESKKEIGTIRRYGVGADVIIMFGSVKSELEEEEANFGSLSKSLKRTMDSLDEVIAICKSNGF